MHARAVKCASMVQIQSLPSLSKSVIPLYKRQGAKLVPNYAENLTPLEELAKLRAPVETFFLKRDRGTGRPTKKDRRQMEDLWSNLSFDVPDDIAERFASDFGFDDSEDDFYED